MPAERKINNWVGEPSGEKSLVSAVPADRDRIRDLVGVLEPVRQPSKESNAGLVFLYWRRFIYLNFVDVVFCVVAVPVVIGWQILLELFFSPFRACSALCVITCTMTVMAIFQDTFVRRNHFLLLVIVFSSCIPGVLACTEILEWMGTEELMFHHPVIASVHSSFARSVGVFVSGVLVSLLSFWLKKLFVLNDPIIFLRGHPIGSNSYHNNFRDEHPVHNEQIDSNNTQKARGSNFKKILSRWPKFLMITLVRMFGVSTCLFVMSSLSVIFFLWSPGTALLNALWRVIVSCIALPGCALTLKWIAGAIMTDLYQTNHRQADEVSNSLRKVVQIQSLLVTGKSVDVFFNTPKIGLIISSFTIKSMAAMAFFSVVAQLFIVGWSTAITLRTTTEKQKHIHNDLVELTSSSRKNQLKMTLFEKLTGTAGIPNHPELYENTSLWTMSLSHELHANIVSIFGVTIYLSLFSPSPPSQLGLRSLILVSFFVLKPFFVAFILPRILSKKDDIESNKEFCYNFYFTHGMMPSFFSRFGVITWMVCSLPFLIQTEIQLHNQHSHNP